VELAALHERRANGARLPLPRLSSYGAAYRLRDDMKTRLGATTTTLILAACLLGNSSPAQAGDITVFLAQPMPSELWTRGFGAALAANLLGIVTIEGEAARLPGSASDLSMTTFTLSGLISPPIGSLVPYGGLGFGFYRQAFADGSDTNVLTALILGVKLKIGSALVIKGEFRNLNLPTDAPIRMDNRYSVGAGIQF